MMKMTLGEYRVGIGFNPSGDELVDKIKRAAADLIELCLQFSQTRHADAEIDRLWSLAMTHFEDGAMWAVKAATKKPL